MPLSRVAPTHNSACSRHSWPLPRGNSNEGSNDSPLLKNAFPITPTLVTRIANRPASSTAPLFPMSMAPIASPGATAHATATSAAPRSRARVIG